MFLSEVFLNKSFDIIMRRNKSFLFCNSHQHQTYLHLPLCIFIFETPSIDSFFRSSQLILLKYAEHLERHYKELYSNIRITLLATWATSRRPRDFTRYEISHCASLFCLNEGLGHHTTLTYVPSRGYILVCVFGPRSLTLARTIQMYYIFNRFNSFSDDSMVNSESSTFLRFEEFMWS